MARVTSNKSSVVSSLASSISGEDFDNTNMVVLRSPAPKYDINKMIGRTILDRRDVLKEIIYDYPETKKLVDLEEDDEAMVTINSHRNQATNIKFDNPHYSAPKSKNLWFKTMNKSREIHKVCGSVSKHILDSKIFNQTFTHQEINSRNINKNKITSILSNSSMSLNHTTNVR